MKKQQRTFTNQGRKGTIATTPNYKDPDPVRVSTPIREALYKRMGVTSTKNKK